MIGPVIARDLLEKESEWDHGESMGTSYKKESTGEASIKMLPSDHRNGVHLSNEEVIQDQRIDLQNPTT